MDKLGIQLPLILAQVVNFAILIFVLSKFLYKPVMKKLAERREKIAAGLALTDSLKIKEEELAKKEAAVIKAAKLEAVKILSQAKKSAQNDREKLLTDTKSDISRLRAKFQTELAAETKAAQKSVNQKSLEIAEGMAARLLADSLDPVTQRKLISKSLAKLQKEYAAR